MCTALSLQTEHHYFGRTFDLDRSYGEEICVLPRCCPIDFRTMGVSYRHHAIIGMATVVEGIPLFYDAANEHGLAMAGLNFPGNASYAPPTEGKENLAPFVLIPWILGQCRTVTEASRLLGRIHLANIPFSEHLPLSPLHWMISDREGSVVVEPMKDGLRVYDNPVGVLTNNPPFPQQLEHWARYRHLRPDNQAVKREKGKPYESYCMGLGAVGLPGDVSSMSRFVRAAFGREHSICERDEIASVTQLFHLLASVSMTRGICRTDENTPDITAYTACIDGDTGRYYYTTYHNRQIHCVDLHKIDLEGTMLHRFTLQSKQSIAYQN